jgi:hypothetical protein
MTDPLSERVAPRARAPPLRIAARAVMASTMPCQPSSCGAPWRALGAARAPPKSRFSAACPYEGPPLGAIGALAHCQVEMSAAA